MPLPSTVAAQPDRMRLWPHQKTIADSIGARAVERVSVLKQARVAERLRRPTVARHIPPPQPIANDQDYAAQNPSVIPP